METMIITLLSRTTVEVIEGRGETTVDETGTDVPTAGEDESEDLGTE